MANNRPSANNRSRFPHITERHGVPSPNVTDVRNLQPITRRQVGHGKIKAAKHRITPTIIRAIIQRICDTVVQLQKSIEYDTVVQYKSIECDNTIKGNGTKILN